MFSLSEAAITPEGRRFSFDPLKFEALWSEIWESLIQEEVPYVLLAPLPAFYGPPGPITLAPGLVIDRFTEDEVKRCLTDDLIPINQWSLVTPSDVAGIRWSGSVRKNVQELGRESQPKPPDPGAFSCRQPGNGHRLVDDVLTLLRLFKAGSVWSPGSIVSFKSWIPYTAPRFRPGPKVGGYALDEKDITGLQGLWNSLTGLVKQFPFLEVGLRRFNIAFDRFEPEDRIVDLLIAAESLFLRDSHGGAKGTPIANRACWSIKHARYTEGEVHDVMRRAYGLRNEIVHGDEEKKETTHLPKKADASLEEFTDAVQEIMQLSLRKAIEVTEAGTEFGTAQYWESHPAPRELGGPTGIRL